MESERNVVAQHYEQTFDNVNQQIDSARQLVEIRKQSKQSPERPYPRRPKNRVKQASKIIISRVVIILPILFKYHHKIITLFVKHELIKY